jgi:hypothetical protein
MNQLSVGVVQDLDQTKKSEGTGCNSVYRWYVLSCCHFPDRRRVRVRTGSKSERAEREQG